jgi:mannose-6-phosphate isomerase-like protein (cupin superfamily)
MSEAPDNHLPQQAPGLYTEHRPWGSFTVLMDLPAYKVKQIQVLPGQRLSLQMHYKREEHWVITRGEPDVTLGEETLRRKKGDYIHIPFETRHRIANPGTEPVEFIEVQLGTYFGEDDIVRFADDYNRVGETPGS